MKVTEINIYPVKSTRRIALTESEVLPRGLPWDRRWMLVDDDGKFITARQHPSLALVSTEINNDSLIVADGQRVSGGCLETEIPATKLECSPPCGEYAHCTDGVCRCDNNFSGK